MKKAVKTVSVLLAAVFVLVLASCGEKSASDGGESKGWQKPAEAQSASAPAYSATQPDESSGTVPPESAEETDPPESEEGTIPQESSEEPAAPPYETVSLKEAAVGDVVVFGSYEQDGDSSNGSEPLEWLVLSKDGDTLLVVTLYGIERMQFHNSLSKVTWETSDVRAWLNGAFLDAAFSPVEQGRIKTSPVVAEANPDYPNSRAGADTEDKVFLLSYQEAEMFFKDEKARVCAPTDAVVASADVYAHTGKSAWYAGHDYICNWWLRSPGMYKDLYVSYIDHSGRISGGGQVYLEGTDLCVRPAMRITVG